MKIPQMILAELRRLTSTPMAILALVSLLAIPVLYGGLYLWANQDPYAHLDELPVALVVQDQGGTDAAGAATNLGRDLAKELVDDHDFQWHQVSEAKAEAGLNDGSFDFAVVIPADFTAAIDSISSGTPRQAQIQLRTNDANSYLATTIGTQAVTRIQTSITEKVVREAGLTMLDALHTVRVNLVDAADGAQQLADGLGTAATGAGSLTDGARQLADGTSQVASGAHALTDGAAQVAAGTAQLADIADRLGAASAQAQADLPDVRARIADDLAAAGLDQAQIDEVLARLDALGDPLAELDDRVQGAVGQIDQLDSGAQQVASGAAQLATGADAAASGAAGLRDGASQLSTGLGTLLTGAQTLQSGLSDGVAQLPDSDDATRAAQAKTLSTPVDLEKSAVTAASNYGAGLAPFFAALAGWIGIYALFLIVKPISRRAVTALHSPVRVTLAGWATPAILGAVQMLALFGVLTITLGFPFAHPWATLGLLVGASMTYAAIILALNVWLGSVGQFLGLVLMVLQLVTAGGTFPWQTLPGPLATLHHLLPMSYVVDGARQLMYGGDLSRVGTDLMVLGGILVGALVVTAIGVARQTRHRTLRDLQPSLIG